jgi:hypothetical protein
VNSASPYKGEHVRENMRVGAPITLEPGPYSISFPKLLYLGPGFTYTSGGKRRLLEAILLPGNRQSPGGKAEN